MVDHLKKAAAWACVMLIIACGSGGENEAQLPGISGRVTIGGTYFAGVTITLTGSATGETTTNSTGYFSFTGLANGVYTITPSRIGCTFSPTAAVVNYLGGITTQDFTAQVTPAIAAGGNHSLALKSDGTVWAWGYNGDGQLGDDTTTTRKTPVPVSGLSGIIAIAAGENHSLALKGNGTVWAWGNNGYGQLGDNSTTARKTPVQVLTLTNVKAIAAGGNHSLALTSSGAVKTWGANNSGQLGDGTVINSKTPVNVSGLLSGISAIAGGASHSLALTSGGAVKAWGANNDGQLGDGSKTNSTTPVGVFGLSSGIAAIAAGGFHSLALTSGGAIKAWGLNDNGQLGNGSFTSYTTPVNVTTLTSGVTSIAAGQSHSLATATGQAAWAWGLNASGQLGDTTVIRKNSPVEVFGLSSGITALSGGGYHSLALTTNANVKAWGQNTEGQLGNDSTWNATSPVDVSSF
jgi:alpha-tubulin suppressor-like RCC1 family protein